MRYYTENYGCPECKQGTNDTGKPVIVKSRVPKALVGKGPASSSAVAWTMYQKYANSIPLYRQEKDWAQYGAMITRTTLANWIIYCSKKYFLCHGGRDPGAGTERTGQKASDSVIHVGVPQRRRRPSDDPPVRILPDQKRR